MKPLKPIALAITALLSSAAFANPKNNNKPLEPSLQERVDQSTEKKISGEWGGKNPSARGCPPNCGFYVTGDFLWWRSENQGFTYASEQPADSLANGKIIRIHPEWDPGFRISAGWNTDYDAWDWTFVWTWYKNHSTSSYQRPDIAADSFAGFTPLFPVSSLTGGLDQGGNYRNAQGSYRLLHNAIDMEIGRAYYITKALSLRPHWGVRGAWLNQKFYDLFSSPVVEAFAEFNRFHGKNNYWGVGPRAGTHANYRFGWGFSVMGQMALSALYGHTDVSFLSELFEPGEDTGFVLDRQYADQFDQLVPNLQLMLGLDWGTCLRNDTMFLAFSLAWETNYWWNQFNLPVVLFGSNDSSEFILPALPNVGNQPVTMEGLTFNARLDF